MFQGGEEKRREEETDAIEWIGMEWREGGRSNLKVLHSDSIQMSYNNFSLSEYTVPR